MGRYRIELSHAGLNKYKVITADSVRVLEQKATAQKIIWDVSV